MPSWEDFFYGSKCAWITADRIQAPSMQRNKEQTALVMNGAFKFYYNAHQGARSISGSGRSPEAIRAVSDLQSKIQADIRSAADFWFGSDLKFVFQDLVKNKGYWKHDEWNGWKGYCNIPQGVFAFYAEIDKRGREVSSQVGQIRSYGDWRKYQADLKRIKDAGQWDRLAKELDYSGQVLEKATPKVWAVLGGADKTGDMLGGLLGKWCGYAGSVHGFLTLANKINCSPDGKSRTAVAELAALVVERLPIFGPLYADVIRGVPGLMTWMENYGHTVNRATNFQF